MTHETATVTLTLVLPAKQVPYVKGRISTLVSQLAYLTDLTSHDLEVRVGDATAARKETS